MSHIQYSYGWGFIWFTYRTLLPGSLLRGFRKTGTSYEIRKTELLMNDLKLMRRRTGPVNAHVDQLDSLPFHSTSFVQRLMNSPDDYAWTPRIFPLSEEPITTMVLDCLNTYLDSPWTSRRQTESWRLQTKDVILNDPVLVLTSLLLSRTRLSNWPCIV